MKRLKFNMAIFFAMLITTSLLATNKPKLKEYVKNITEYADIDNDGDIYINNQFGKVNITTSNNGRVDATITITIDTKSQQNADEFFERVHVDIDHSMSQFEINTSFDSPSWWKTIWSANNDYKYTIDMEIAIPTTCDLHLVNRHGDAYVEDLEGDFTLDLSFGNAECNAVSGDLEVELEHADASFTTIQDVDLDIQYGKFICTSAADIDSDSQFSKVYIDAANNVSTVTQYDEYHFGKIVSIDNEGQFDDIKIDYTRHADLETQYTKVVIDYLEESGNFETQFGSLHIKDAQENLEEIDIECQYTQVSLVINTAYLLDIESQFGSLNLENDLNITSKEKSIGQHDIEGYHLSENADATINVEMQFGSFRLRH